MTLRWLSLAVLMKLPHITARAILLAFVVATLWLVLILISPYLIPAGTLTDISGRVGGHENEDQFEGLNPVAHAVYWLGDAECHQLANRSYFLNDNQMPFCSRDLGLFAGVALGFGIATFYRPKVKPWLYLIAIAPLALDGGLQAITSYESNNPLRLATGVLAGVGLALLLAEFVFVLAQDASEAKAKKPTE